MVESSRVEVSCVVLVESSDGGVESSRVEVSCVVMVYSIVVMVEVVESSGVEVS